MNGNRYREGEVGAGRPERRADEEQLADARVQRQPRQVLAERRERLACVRAQPQARARERGGQLAAAVWDCGGTELAGADT